MPNSGYLIPLACTYVDNMESGDDDDETFQVEKNRVAICRKHRTHSHDIWSCKAIDTWAPHIFAVALWYADVPISMLIWKKKKKKQLRANKKQ